MRCLIVGADRVGKKKEYLYKKYGVSEVLHWNGRGKKLLPMPDVDLVFVITDFAKHPLVLHAKKEARRINAKLVFVRRGISELEKSA
jgi:hypothetical protein